MTSRTRSWPLWLFVAISLLLNVSLPPLVMWIEFGSFEEEIQAAVFLAGVIVGEVCFVVLVAGLTKRTWLGGHLFGLGLAVAAYCAFLGGLWLADEVNREMTVGLALLPVFLLAAASPLSGLRQVFGWRLVFEDDALSRRQPLRLADIFSQIAIVSSVLVLARVPQVILETSISNHWLPVAITCLILFGTSLVILPLYARVVFGGLSVRRKAAWLGILPILIACICFGISQCFMSRDTSWSERLEVLPFLLALLVPAIGVFYLSLLLLAATGMRLVLGSHRTEREPSECDVGQVARLQRLTWWRIGGAVAVTMATSIYLAHLEQWRAVRDKENARLDAIVRATGGALGVFDRIPMNLTLGAKATDDDFAAIAICTKLEYLYLQGSGISDDGMRQLEHLSSLRLLSLENIQITDAGLVPLAHLPNLELLTIQNCDVKASSIRSLPKKRRLQTLDLTETPFGDDECEMLAEFPALSSLTLNHTRITDRSLVTIGKILTLNQLHLVGTDVKAERFPALAALHDLDLSHTRANDATVASIAQLSKLQYLSLRDTKITNAALPMLSQLNELYHVDLSDNPIDDEGIRELGRNNSLASIDLSCTRVTGTGFATWQPKSRSQDLILDRTLVDDAGIAALISIGEVDELSLANTAVTDACLPHLARIAISKLDIRGTQLTFNGLVGSGLPSVSKLQVASGQFTPQQILQLKQQLRIEVDD